MKYNIVIVAVLLASCSPHHGNQLQIAGFETQVHAFEVASNEAGRPLTVDDLIIQLDPTLEASGEDGRCTTYTNATPIILISASYWATATDQGKEVIIFHEMGHCILGRVHRNDLNGTLVPNSVMYYSAGVFNSNENDYIFYESNRAAYISELFAK
jgi:hypothetical protein